MSTRAGGVSRPPFDSLNLRPPGLPGEALDDPPSVFENQQRFSAALGAHPVWLDQVHGCEVLTLKPSSALQASMPRADASITVEPGVGCTVLVADCLPVLLCCREGRGVGAAHAGWRGLAAGVLDRTVQAMCEASGASPDGLLAWLGPCIGADAFEVGPDVLQAFGIEPRAADARHFRLAPRADGCLRWRADLVGLANERLHGLGVKAVYGGRWCTVGDASRFFSFRRDGRTGRLAAGIALAVD